MIQVSWQMIVFTVGVILIIYKMSRGDDNPGYGVDMVPFVWGFILVFWIILWGGIMVW